MPSRVQLLMRNLLRSVWMLSALFRLVGAEAPDLNGTLEDNRYTPQSGRYSITLPIQIELGGTITDTAEVVTFQDNFRLHTSIACFPLSASQHREIQSRGTRDFLVSFFRQHVQTQFNRRFPGAKIEAARYLPEVLQGALLVYNTLPGGTMFTKHALLKTPEGESLPANRGNLLFLQNSSLFVVSLELASLLPQNETSREITSEDRQEFLRKELLGIVGRISFQNASPQNAIAAP